MRRVPARLSITVVVCVGLVVAGADLLPLPRRAVANSVTTVSATTAATPEAAAVSMKPEGILTFEVRDTDGGSAIPCKLTFEGVAGSHDPEFTHNDIGRQEIDAITAYNRIMSLTGIGGAHVPVGTYDVTISRGPEWDIQTERKVKITPTRPVKITAHLSHVVDTHEWLSADFHVHAARSPDSHVPMEDRIYEFVADGVEMIVSTDHNVVSDYEPFIRALNAGRYITSAVGDELTTGGWGHFGAFPLPHDLEKPGQGAVLVHGRRPDDFFKDVRTHAPDAIIDVHHPRIDAEIGYFDLGHFDAAGDRAERPGFSWDFDAIEVMNGYQDPVRRSVDRVVNDWFALLNHNHIVTATGNSDTHHLTFNIGGYPRNYVHLKDDRPQWVDAKAVASAVRFHHAFFTTGPFVTLQVNGGTIGDVVPAPHGKALAEITVQAAPWVSVDRVTLFVNGQEMKRWEIPASQAAVRFKQSFAFSIPTDGYVVARVDGAKPLSPVVGDRKTFTAYPFALTNPVFLDVDGDGSYRTGNKHGH